MRSRPSRTPATKPTRYISPYQRTAIGPSGIATGSNWGWTNIGGYRLGADYTEVLWPPCESAWRLRIARSMSRTGSDPIGPLPTRMAWNLPSPSSEEESMLRWIRGNVSDHPLEDKDDARQLLGELAEKGPFRALE